jgi:hypothetical protein
MLGRASLGLAAAAVAGLASPAFAADERMGTGLIYGTASQFRGVCYFTNIGGAPITIRNFAIRTLTVNSVTLAVNECGSVNGVTLAPRSSCGIAAAVGNEASSCLVITSNRKNTRGTFEVRDNAQTVRNSQALK